jgi:hypothetical protein
MPFNIDRTVSISTVIAIIGGFSWGYYSLKSDIAILGVGIATAGEAVEAQQKLSASNTEDISELKDAVKDLTTAIIVQNKTITFTGRVRELKSDNIERRLDELKERIDRKPD